MTDPVRALLATIDDAARRADAEALVALFERATGQRPRVEGSVIAFGAYRYRYPSGREGEAAAAGFAPGGREISVYLVDGVGFHRDDLARLGPHRAGVGSIRFRALDGVDLDVLERIVAASYRRLTAGVYTKRAREGGAT